jgi:CrcB protein
MRLVLAAFTGGVAGTGLRLGIDLLLPHDAAGFPLGTLLVNTVGALVLGCLVAGLWLRPSTPAWLKVALGPGLLGSFTTFSALMVSVVALSSAALPGLAALYLGLSVALGFAAAALGLWLGTQLGGPALRPGIADDGATL